MLEVKVICCYSVRTCRDYSTFVIDVNTMQMERFNAVRCHRGEEKILKITEPERYIVFHDEKSFKGRHNIKLVHKPSAMTVEEAMKIIRELLGLVEVEVI